MQLKQILENSHRNAKIIRILKKWGARASANQASALSWSHHSRHILLFLRRTGHLGVKNSEKMFQLLFAVAIMSTERYDRYLA